MSRQMLHSTTDASIDTAARWVLASADGRISLRVDGVEQGVRSAPLQASHGVEPAILLDGYVLPRRSSPVAATSHRGTDLVREAWRQFGERFTEHLKGVFSVLILDADGAHVFTDHLGIRKVFYARRPGGFVIANSLEGVLQEVDTTVDTASVALNALLHHYVGGWTCFASVRFSGPAASLRGRELLAVSQYWSPDRLLELSPVSMDYPDLADEMVGLMAGYLWHLGTRNPTVTLTGGMDSRTLLALLLRNRVQPRAFTFGNPASSDAAIAKEIAARCGLAHAVHGPASIDARWFGDLARRITEVGDSLTHIHRAHRLDGVLRELACDASVDMLFLGCMGGEGIRGLHIDDLIVTRFVRECWEQPGSLEQRVDAYLDRYWVRRTGADRDELLGRLASLPYLRGGSKENEFRVLYEMVAGIHHGQDVNLYGRYIRHVVPFFMDIDYLELLFASPFSMLRKRNTSRNQLNRLDIPAFNSHVVRHLSPEMAEVPFANGYSPNDYLAGPLRYLFRRIAHRISTPPRTVNFGVDGWISEFVLDGLGAPRSPLTGAVYTVDDARAELLARTPPPGEGSWRRFSDIVASDLAFHRFAPEGATPRRPLRRQVEV